MIAYPPAVARTLHVADDVVTYTSRPSRVFPPTAAMVADLPTFTDFGATGRAGCFSATVVEVVVDVDDEVDVDDFGLVVAFDDEFED